MGNRVVEAKEDNIKLKTLTTGAKCSDSKYTDAQLYKYIKSLVVSVVEQLYALFYRCLTHV